MSSPDVHRVVVVGSGGVGKSALTLQVKKGRGGIHAMYSMVIQN